MKRFWKAMAMAAAFFAVFTGIQLWLSLTMVLFFISRLIFREGMGLFSDVNRFLELYLAGITQHMTGMILLSNLLTILVFWAFFALRQKQFAKEIGLERLSGKNALLSVLFGVGVCFTVGLVTELLPAPQDMMEEFAQAHSMLSQGSVITGMLSVALVGPISEEICFRGLCYTRLKTGMRPLLAGLVSSALFGIAHGNPIWFLVGLLAGFAMAWIFETTGSLWAAILVHITNNTISQITAYIPITPLAEAVLVVISAVLLILSGYLLYRNNPRPMAPADL